MRITLISFDNWGFNEHIASSLKNKGHKVEHIDFSKFEFRYKNSIQRVYNFILKTFLKQNLKTKFYGQEIIKQLNKNSEKQDLILTIKGDFIAPEYAKQIKNYTSKSIAFFNDNTARCPKIIGVLDCFDDVYAFDKKDCEKYNLKFKSNFIYNFIENPKYTIEFDIFNISTLGNRTNLILKIANQLKLNQIKYKIIVYDKKEKLKNNLVTLISKPIALNQVNNYIESTNSLLDIHRENQQGLSFRVFESLGLQKKLITTNSDIINYDFFNENNILVIDSKQPIIPKDFFSKPYQEINKSILNNYLTDGWVNEFLN